jgi:hypothetical protein
MILMKRREEKRGEEKGKGREEKAMTEVCSLHDSFIAFLGTEINTNTDLEWREYFISLVCAYMGACVCVCVCVYVVFSLSLYRYICVCLQCKKMRERR